MVVIRVVLKMEKMEQEEVVEVKEMIAVFHQATAVQA
jgi:hypothetical protein